jgi:hypothetical protein
LNQRICKIISIHCKGLDNPKQNVLVYFGQDRNKPESSSSINLIFISSRTLRLCGETTLPKNSTIFFEDASPLECYNLRNEALPLDMPPLIDQLHRVRMCQKDSPPSVGFPDFNDP